MMLVDIIIVLEGQSVSGLVSPNEMTLSSSKARGIKIISFIIRI